MTDVFRHSVSCMWTRGRGLSSGPQ